MNYYLTAFLLGLCLASLGLGIYISMRIFNLPDITTDGSYTLGGAITGVLLTNQMAWPIAFVLVLLCGGIAGALTGFIHTRFKINALLAGILVMTALYSINLLLMNRSNIPLIGESTLFTLPSLLMGELVGKLSVLLVFAMSCCLFVIWILKTDFGIAMRATGNSEIMVRAQGVNADRMKILGLAIANSLVATSGFLVVQLQGFVDINMGIGIVILGLGAVIIGETFTKWLNKNSLAWRIAGVLAGTFLFRFILAYTLSLGLNPNLIRLVTAMIVLLIVALPQLKKEA